MASMALPKIISHPKDPSAPSFLELPAEIRNLIYELIFENDGLTLLHNADAYFPREPDPEDYDEEAEKLCRCDTCAGCMSHYERDLLAWGQAKEKDQREMRRIRQAFSHDFQVGLGLLESCRQIHHEASGVLYGHNTFAISRSTSRHDRHPNVDHEFIWHASTAEIYDNEGYFQMNYAARWLASIGGNYSFLRTVIIDTDAMCPSQCRYAADYDLLPFLRMMWTHPEARCDIVFEPTGRELLRHDAREYAIDFVDLNTILDTLGKQDALGLRRVSRSIESVVIGQEGQLRRHYVEYKRSGLRRHFNIMDKGAKLTWEPPKSIKPLADLPRSIRYIISRYITLAPGGITMDLTAHAIYGLDLKHSCVIPRSPALLIQPGYPVTIEMTSRRAETSFKRFRALDNLLWPEATKNDIVSHIARGEYGRTSGQCIYLNFILDESKDIEDIQVNIKGLVRFLSSMPILKSNMWSTININLEDKEGLGKEFVPIPITELRQAVFLFFTDLLLTDISSFDMSWKPTDTPDVKIDGFGAIVNQTESLEQFCCAEATSWTSPLSTDIFGVYRGSKRLQLAWEVDKIRQRARMTDVSCSIDRRYECLLHAWDDLRRCMEIKWGSLDDALERSGI